MGTHLFIRRFLVAGVAFLAVYALFFYFFAFATLAQASTSDWFKGANVISQSTTDFSSDTFKQSVQNLKATGATYAVLVVSYYQANTGSSDIAPGWNTPTDAALASAIDYAHSIGLKVAIKIFDESYTGEWRAYISPSNRATWYKAYGDILVHLAQIGQAHSAEMMILGTEMISVASSQVNSNNTQQWVNMIDRVRSVYSGKLTYGANSNCNCVSTFENEKKYIGFWSLLDYVGLSTYYELQGTTLDSLKGSWDYWNKNDLMPFQKSVGKPLIFTEIGYRSVDGAHIDPWNSGRSGNYNETEQANDYEALMSYWNDYPYMQGVFWWDWMSNPNAGGTGDTGYTPQHKPAEAVMKKWFTQAAPPPAPGAQIAFSSTGSSNPTAPAAGTQTTLNASLKAVGSAVSDTIVDVEIYNSSANTKIFQQFFSAQQFAAGQTRTYSPVWMPNAAGTYRMTIGVFNNDWTKNYHWNNQAASIVVGGAATPPPNPPPPSGSYTTNIWWPSNNASVSGMQPFKAMLEGLPISQYNMYWQVDGGPLNLMSDSPVDYPHKESLVDLSGWKWRGNGPYFIQFISKDSGGAVIGQKSVNIWVQ
jgi:hypothetical protein